MRYMWTVLLAAPLWAAKPWGPADPYRHLRNRPHPLVGRVVYEKGNVVRTFGRTLTLRVQGAPAYPGTPEEAARAFLRERGADLGISPEAVGALVTKKILAHRNTEVVRFQQTVAGVPVFGGEVVVMRDARSKRVAWVHSRFFPGLEVDVTPKIPASQAYALARAQLPFRQVQRTLDPELVVYPQGKGRLAWRVLIPSLDPLGDWEIFVDAHTGEVFFIRDQAKYADGSGMVWFPDPLTTAGRYYNDTPEWADNNDADNDSLNGQRVVVPLRGLTYNTTVGGYMLRGPWAWLDEALESPNSPLPTPADSTAFVFTRTQQEFEAVMVYFHFDSLQRYFQTTLGITFANAEPQDVDPHGLNGDDNSYYVPSSDYIAFGEGGVDDAEDADVIVHEYGHAIQDDIVPGWGAGGDAGAMGEGFGDYIATTWSMSVDTFRWHDVFTWDGHNEFWPGRRCNTGKIYPDSLVGQVHADGELWCSALLDVVWAMINAGYSVDSARHIMDYLVLKHHTLLSTSATMPEAAQAIIQVDQTDFGGAHLSFILPAFDARQLIDMTQYVPQITHTPLPDNEDVNGPYDVYAHVIPAVAPIDSVILFYWTSLNPGTTTSVVMSPVGADSFHAQIPGPGQEADIFYYIYAVDTSGAFNTDPAGAPSAYHQFHVGADTIPPVIVHTPIRSQFPQSRWPAVVRAQVTDNLGVQQVYVEWTYNGAAQSSFTLTFQGNDVYEAPFPLASVNLGDVIEYRIVAVDASSGANQTVDPPSGYHTFTIVQTRGVVLVINDDTGDRKAPEKGGSDTAKFATGEVADSLASWLAQLGFDVVQEDAAVTDTTQWGTYDFIVWSAGEDIATVGQASGSGGPAYADALRAALLNYLAAGGRVFFEGGELGYDAQVYDLTFAQQALHITDWSSDDAGTQLLLTSPAHPIASTPNPLTDLPLASGTGYGDHDALLPTTDAMVVFEPATNPGNVGLLAYHNPSTGEAVVFLSVAYLYITDSALAVALLENVAEYLLSPVAVQEGSARLNTVRLLPQAGGLRLLVPTTAPVQLVLFNPLGRKVLAEKLSGSTEYRLRLDLPMGLYFYRVITGTLKRSGKVILVR